MTSYNPPTDTELNANKPGVFTLFRRLRDMGPAITEGSAGAPKNTIASISPSATVRRVIATDGAGAAVWGTLADMFRADVASRNTGAITDISSAGTVITTVDLGSVKAGDRILVTAFFGYTGAGGQVHGSVNKNAGTATIVAMDTSGSLFSTSTNDAAGNIGVSGIIKVTADGTLTLQLEGFDAGNTADVAINFGQLHAIVLVGG
jgi:hypothetical protein